MIRRRGSTFAIGSDGCVTVILPNRVSRFANRMYATGHHPLTRHEQMIVRVMRDIHAPAHIAGLDTTGIAKRTFAPNREDS